MDSAYKPLVSVVTIFLDEERFLGEAVESVLAQSYDNWELLLVDDGSTDASTDIALRYARRYPEQVRYLHHPGYENRGRSASRNLGIANAEGEYIAFLDADDVWLPPKLEQQVEVLESHPEAGMVYGRTLLWYSWSGDPEDTGRDFLDSSTRLDTLFTPPDLLTLFLQQINGYPCTCGVLVRREIVEAVGGFEEEFWGLYDDSVFWAKVFLTTPVFVTSECADLYRQHSESSWANALRTGEWHPTKPHPGRLPFLEWLEKYLAEKEVKDPELWCILCRELRLYRHPTAPVEIGKVGLSGPDPERLWGSNIEVPQPGDQTNDYGVAIRGWVLGRSSSAVAVEVLYNDSVVARAPVAIDRPDIEAAFPSVPGAARSGFRATVGVAGMGELGLGVRAVLKDQSRVPLGAIRARRRWREGDYGVGAALVSVVIPCHNQAHFLGEAIESVLSQTYPHFEAVVVDDGSSDNTEEVASRYPGVRCVRQENLGLAAARNMGIRRSKGAYLVFLDADDRLLPGALEAGLSALKAHPESAFAAGRYRYIGFDGSPLLTPQPPRPQGDHYLALLSDNFIAAPAVVMYRRPVFEYVTGFDPSMSPAEDYDLYLRIAREFPIHCHEEVVSEHRQKDTKLLDNPELMFVSILNVLQSQRRYVKESKRYGQAHMGRISAGRAYYGEQLAKEVRTYAHKHERRQALRGTTKLLRYYPRGFLSALRRTGSGINSE